MILKNGEINQRQDLLSIIKSKKIVIFGAGLHGCAIKQDMEKLGYDIVGFCDNDIRKVGTTILGKEVYHIDDIKKMDVYILIASDFYREISQQLLSLGIDHFHVIYKFYFSKENIEFLNYFNDESTEFPKCYSEEIKKVYNFLEDEESKKSFESVLNYRATSDSKTLMIAEYKQYFHPVIHPKQGDIIIDGGAFIGDTAFAYYEYLDKRAKIYSFEPDIVNYNSMLQTVKEKSIENIKPIAAGLSNSSEIKYMNSYDYVNWGSSVADEGDYKVCLVAVDQFVKDENIKIDLIKMDIEGYEMKALEGAMEIIKRDLPRLQICIYHKPLDIIEIPIYLYKHLKEYGYKFYLGHHFPYVYETVLYAGVE